MPKKIPIRQCAACRERREKTQLVRVVRTPEGDVVLDLKGKVAGRGVYICPSIECFERVVKSNALSRALSCEIPPEIISQLRQQIKECADG